MTEFQAGVEAMRAAVLYELRKRDRNRKAAGAPPGYSTSLYWDVFNMRIESGLLEAPP